jgi:tetratricopeptide (TPR) repeat protein
MLALSLLAKGQQAQARKIAEEAIVDDPDDAFAYYAAAFIHFQQDDLKKSRKLIAEAIRLSAENPHYLNISSRIFLVQGKLKEALEEAERSLQADPAHVSSLNSRAMALIRLGRGKEAMESVDRALQLNPGDAPTRANKGWLLLEQNRGKDAMDHFKEALRLQPDNAWAREGIIESMKHRHLVYAAIAAGSLALSKVARTGPLFWVIWLIPPMRAFYLLLLLTAWLGNQFFNLVLCLDPLTRRVLTDSEKKTSLAFGLLVCLAMTVPLASLTGLLREGGAIIA